MNIRFLITLFIITYFGLNLQSQSMVRLDLINAATDQAVTGFTGNGRITSYNVCYTKLLRLKRFVRIEFGCTVEKIVHGNRCKFVNLQAVFANTCKCL